MTSAFGSAVRGALATLLIAALAACGEPSPDPAATTPDSGTEPPSSADDRLSAGEHAWTTADDNTMPYVVAGEGDTTVLLVHCWMCDRTFWSKQVPALTSRYRTIAVDLPGHGEASAERANWTVSGYGDDVAGLIEALDLRNVVLVGHSMGGPVSLRAAALSGDRVRGIIAVDTLHDAEFEFPKQVIDQMLAAFSTDFQGTCSAFVKTMFVEEGVEDVIGKVTRAGCNPERAEVGSALMQDFGAIDMERWFSEAGVPVRAINAATPMPTRIESNRKYADFDAVLMENVGHYPHMTRPDQFNPLLLEAIETMP